MWPGCADTAVGDDIPAQLADTILASFVAKYGAQLSAPPAPARGPPPKFKFTTELYAARAYTRPHLSST